MNTQRPAPDTQLTSTGTAIPLTSAEFPDWSREELRCCEWDPGKRLLRTIRVYQRARERGGLLGTLVAKLAVLHHRFWSAVSGADIPLNCRIDGGLLIPHPNGIVVHPEAEIGPNCLIFQQATIGMRKHDSGAPRLGGHVDVGAGARVLGDIVVNEHARIGANAVVLCDVPVGGAAVGVPARIRTYHTAGGPPSEEQEPAGENEDG